MAEDEAQAERDWMVELRRKLETEKGLSEREAMKLVLAMADQEKLIDWIVRDLEKGTPEERAAWMQKVLDMAGIDIHDLDDDDDDDEPQSH
jgi:hypothetical protein